MDLRPVAPVMISILLISGAVSGDRSVSFDEDGWKLTPFTLDELIPNSSAWEVHVRNGEISAAIEGERINITGSSDWWGEGEIEVTANGSTVLILVTVNPVNDLPAIENVSAAMEEGEWRNPINASAEAYDVDGDPLTYSWFVDGEKILEGRNITWYLFPGTHELTLLVEDGNGGSASMNWTVTARAPPGWDDEPDNDRNRIMFWLIFGAGGVIFTAALIWVFKERREE